MRALRIAGIVAGAFVALAVVLLLLASWLFDPNDHKGRIETAFREATGRELRLEGGLSLSLFPWLAVQTGRATVANREGFGETPFASLEHARLGVRLWPLLTEKRVEFGPVRVDGLALDLVVRRDGTDNWSDVSEHLERRRAAEAPGSPPAESTDLSVARVEFRDAALRYTDERDGRVLALEDWQLQTGRLGAGAPAAVETSLRLVRDGAPTGTLELRTRVEPPTDGHVVLDATEATLSLEREGHEPSPVEVRAPRITVARATRAIEVPELEVRLGPARVTGTLAVDPGESGLAAQGRLTLAETRLRTLLDAFAIEPPVTRDPNVLGPLESTATFSWTSAAGLRLEPFELRLDETRLSGRLALQEFAPVVTRFELKGDAIDLDRYLPPPAAATAEGPEAPSTPPEPGEALDARGSIAFDRVGLAGVALERVDAKLRVAGGRLVVDPLRSRAFGGTLTTTLRYDYAAEVPTLGIDQRFDGVDVAALLGQAAGVRPLEGRGRGRFELTSQGVDGAALFANLQGPYEVTVTDGAIVGVDLRHEIERAVAAARLDAAAASGKGSGRTPFERLAARGTLRDRALANERIDFAAGFASVTGRGRIDYGRGALDLDLEARLLETPEGRVFGLELDRVKGVPVPLRVTGSPADPKVRPDTSKLLESAAKEAVREPVERKIREQLEKIFR